jgi:hypothetical protein
MLVALSACSVISRHCDAPVLLPKSPPAELGIKYTPTCQGFVLDFDSRFWFATNNEDAVKLCDPGDSVMLIDANHIQYVRSNGTSIPLGSPAHEHRLGCA